MSSLESPPNDVVFEESGVCKLRTPVVHDLIEDLVDETELFFDIVLGDLSLTVRLADEDQRVEELDGHGGVDVGLGGGQEDEVLVGDSDVGDPVEVEDGSVPVLLCGHDLRAVVQDLSTGDVVLEGPVDEDFPLDIDEDHGTYHI